MQSDFTAKTLQCLPAAYRSDPWLTALLEALRIEYDAQQDTLADLYAQFFIDSMTWHLTDEEREAGLPVRPSSPPENRRAVVKARWRGAEKVDIALIRDIVRVWENTHPMVSYDGKRFHVAVSFFAEKVDLPALIRQLRETIPAHLFMTATARTYPIEKKVFISGVQSGMISRVMLPVLEPEQDFSTALSVNGASGAVSSRAELEPLEPEQNFSATFTVNGASGDTSSRTELEPLEPEQNFSATFTVNGASGAVSSRMELELEQDFSAEISFTPAPAGNRSRIPLKDWSDKK